jgi:hypothetical protein
MSLTTLCRRCNVSVFVLFLRSCVYTHSHTHTHTHTHTLTHTHTYIHTHICGCEQDTQSAGTVVGLF